MGAQRYLNDKVLWLKFVKSFSFPRPWKGVNWFLICSFCEWYLLCVLSPFCSAIPPFQAGKPLLRKIASSAEPRWTWQLSYTSTILKYVSLELDSLTALIFSLCTCRECLGARDPYCGWDNKQKRCTTIEDSSNMSLWTQNITECPVSGNILYVYGCMSICICVKAIEQVNVWQPEWDWLIGKHTESSGTYFL